MPWMDWNSEVAADWPGTDGREFVHGLTHEFDSFAKTLSKIQGKFVDTWSGACYNDRAGFGVGQVYGPISRFERKVQTVRLLQIDVAVRDDRSVTGWLFGTFAYDGRKKGATAWDRMVPLGLQWGSNPKVTYVETCDKDGKCGQEKLTEQWIDDDAVASLTTDPIALDHLGYGGRLAGPVDNPKAACMGCHQTAGFPAVAIEPEASALAPILGIDDTKTATDHQDYRMSFYRNVVSGTVFSDRQLYSSDFSLQLSMSLTNFTSLHCAVRTADKPEICGTMTKWADAMRNYVDEMMTFGTPGPGGAPLVPASK
jgi:hypothetical protein